MINFEKEITVLRPPIDMGAVCAGSSSGLAQLLHVSGFTRPALRFPRSISGHGVRFRFRISHALSAPKFTAISGTAC